MVRITAIAVGAILLAKGANAGWLDALKQAVDDAQKHFSDKADEAKKHIEDKVDEAKDKAKEQWEKSKGAVHSYKEAAENYAKALKDKSFTDAIKKSGLCDDLADVEEAAQEKIEANIPSNIADLEIAPDDDPKACEAVIDQATDGSLMDELKGKDYGEEASKLMKLFSEKSSGAMCEGKNGIQDWLKEHADLKLKDPAEYKKELAEKLNGKVNGFLKEYTDEWCPKDDRLRLFAISDEVVVTTKSTNVALLAGLGSLVVGSAVVTSRRLARRSSALPEGSELLDAEDSSLEA